MRNRTFREMEKAALERLSGIDPCRISARTDIPFDETTSTFRFSSIGIDVTVSYPSYDIFPHLPDWHHLMILHHLEMADGTPRTEKQISFRELPDGFVRGEQFDRSCESTIAAVLGNYRLETLRSVAIRMGAIIGESRADLCAKFSFAPRYPITLNLWLAEEDLPGSGKMLLDSSAGHQLSTEDAVTVGELILEQMKTLSNEMS